MKRKDLGCAIIAWAAALVVTLGLLFLCSRAHAHDHTRPDLKSWFLTLHNKKDVPCCDGSDATRLSDVDWESRDGHYRVKLEGEWVDVPDEAVIEQPNMSGPTLVWPYYLNGAMRGVRCFLPGSMT